MMQLKVCYNCRSGLNIWQSIISLAFVEKLSFSSKIAVNNEVCAAIFTLDVQLVVISWLWFTCKVKTCHVCEMYSSLIQDFSFEPLSWKYQLQIEAYKCHWSIP